LQVFADRNRASIEGLNLLIKHLRPRRQGRKGPKSRISGADEYFQFDAGLPEVRQTDQVGHKTVEKEKKNKKYRLCKKCNQVTE
jgi:large subunit ribosomal protein L24